MNKIIFALVIALLPSSGFSAPAITGFNQGTGVISGSGFGSKTTAAPVVWDNVEDGACNTTATVGSWTTTNHLSAVTSASQRGTSQYSCDYNFTDTNVDNNAAMTGGTDSQRWFGQYWFYFPANTLFSQAISGNTKFFRLWSSGSATENFRATFEGYDVSVAIEYQSGIGTSYDWSPVKSGYDWVDLVFGHADPGYVDPGKLGWKFFETDLAGQTWHQVQIEYVDSTAGTADGRIKLWVNGTLILERTAIMTRDSGETTYKRFKYLGFEETVSTTHDGDEHVYFDDFYIDNTLARVELCTGSTWAAKGRCEIQPPTNWGTTSATVTFNQGAFASETTAYLYVVDSAGDANASGFEITIDGGSSITCYPDADNDLYPGSGSESVETCSSGYYESSHFTAMTADCNDASAAINPGATETCGDSIDQDCSGADLACSSTAGCTGSTTGTIR